MLKGVHHQIIEIRQTEDPYFERALLFVRAECAEVTDWQAQGRAFIKQAKPHTGLRKARLFHGLQAAGWWLSGGLCGAVLSILLSKIG